MPIAFKIQEEFQSGIGQLVSVFSDVSAWVVFDRPRLISKKMARSSWPLKTALEQ